jgi:hypothetical protein
VLVYYNAVKEAAYNALKGYFKRAKHVPSELTEADIDEVVEA